MEHRGDQDHPRPLRPSDSYPEKSERMDSARSLIHFKREEMVFRAEKILYKMVPPSSLGFYSFFIFLSFIHLFLSLFFFILSLYPKPTIMCLYSRSYYIWLTYQFPCPMCYLLIKLHGFVDPLSFVIPFSHKHLQTLRAPSPLRMGWHSCLIKGLELLSPCTTQWHW